MRRSKVLSEGSNCDKFFVGFSWLGGEDQTATISKWAIIAPPAKHHLNGASLTADDGTTLNAGLLAAL